MKHSIKITLVLVVMFFIAQLIGIFVASVYAPKTVQVINETTGALENKTGYPNLPSQFKPPEDVSPKGALYSIIFAVFLGVILMLSLMKFKAEIFLKSWFLVVIVIGIALCLNAFIIKLLRISIPNSFYLALLISIPLGLLKMFKRNMFVHNITELMIYPGIASVFIPLLSVWTVVFLLFIISIYDMYAVWHAGFMQKMAKYQIEKLKIFSGFFVPYFGKKERELIRNAKKSNTLHKLKNKKIKINVAILGGGDVVFPIILAGVVLQALGLAQALIIALGATAALSFLFYISEKGKFYPAMPFISAGCLIALGIAYLI